MKAEPNVMHKGRLNLGSTFSVSHSVKRDATDPPNAAPVMITCFLDLSNSINCKTTNMTFTFKDLNKSFIFETVSC